jgi:hypothetical protein
MVEEDDTRFTAIEHLNVDEDFEQANIMKLATGKIHSNPGLKKYNETSVLS